MAKWEFVLAMKGFLQKEAEKVGFREFNSVDVVFTLCNKSEGYLENCATSCGLDFTQGSGGGELILYYLYTVSL